MPLSGRVGFWRGGCGGGEVVEDVVLQVAALPIGYVVPRFNSRWRALRRASEPCHVGRCVDVSTEFHIFYLCDVYEPVVVVM